MTIKTNKLYRRYYGFMISQQIDRASIDELEQLVLKMPPCEYAIILHDKDGTTHHHHIALYFKNARTITAVAKDLNIAPNFIEKWDNRKNNLFGYLLHTTNQAKNLKANYTDYLTNPQKFRTNIDNYLQLALKSPSKTNIDKIINDILTGSLNKKQLLTPDNLRLYYDNKYKIDRAFKIRGESLILNPPACTTIFITGGSGTGKTRTATGLATKIYGEHNYCIASSPNDPLQDYTDEKCFIIDDFRPQDYEFIELLALLDPYNRKRTHRSRYYNKILAPELIIITSTYDINAVMSYYRYTNEDMLQLRRRIQQLVIRIDKDTAKYQIYDDITDTYNDIDELPFTP